ncbi:MAG: hypothetical protein JJU12_00355 [Chlamydiales bacterium]|nr:hypothetical protein [Chlamydiales bacterium]
MTFWDEVVYYIFFGWAWGSQMKKDKFVANIQKEYPDLTHSTLITLRTLNLNQLKSLNQVLTNTYARDHLKAATPHALKEILEQYAANPKMADLVFANFAKAQQLLSGRIDQATAFYINTFFLNQSSDVINDMEAFLTEAQRLENMKPNTFHLAPSEETRRLTTELKPKLQLTDPLVMNLLGEIEFVVVVNNTQIISQAVESIFQKQERVKPDFHILYHSPVPFALLFATETTTTSIIISVSDPQTKEVRRVEIAIPEKLTAEELHGWLSNSEQTALEGEKKEAAEAFKENSHQTLAKLIYGLKEVGNFKLPSKRRYTFEDCLNQVKLGNIFTVYYGSESYLSLSPQVMFLMFEMTTLLNRDCITSARYAISEGQGTIRMNIRDALYQDEVNVTSIKETDKLSVTYTYQGKTHQCRYLLKEGEDEKKLSKRISRDKTLERDLLVMKADFTRLLNLGGEKK